MTDADLISPGAGSSGPMTLGILGGGQLGKMTAQAAQRLGYQVHIFTPEADSPALAIANAATVADWDDLPALNQFALSVDVITLEFENIPASTVRTLEAWTPVFPQASVLEITQDRCREKTFLRENGFPVSPFSVLTQPEALEFAARNVGFPLVLKTARSGYDGKGQARAENLVALRCAYASLANNNGVYHVDCTLEKFISLEREISVIGARGGDGEIVCYPPIENYHNRHILDFSRVPATISPTQAAQAMEITRRLMLALDLKGLLCVEFFIDRNGTLMVNELAPRPHNSGHCTLEAAECSQFEQLVRAVMGLPLGSATISQPAAMANLLGDLWEHGEPDWKAALQDDGVSLHLYGKSEPRPGRKMGHLTVVADTAQEAENRALQARKRLTEPSPVHQSV